MARSDQLEPLQKELFEVQTNFLDADEEELLKAYAEAHPDTLNDTEQLDQSESKTEAVVPEMKKGSDLLDREKDLMDKIVSLTVKPVCTVSDESVHKPSNSSAASELNCSDSQLAVEERWEDFQEYIGEYLGYDDQLSW